MNLKVIDIDSNLVIKNIIVQYATLKNIRKYHMMKFTGSHHEAFACESPTIISRDLLPPQNTVQSEYKWTLIRIPQEKSRVPRKRKSCP